MGLIVISPLLRKRHPLLAELNTPPSDSLLSAALPEPCRGLPRNLSKAITITTIGLTIIILLIYNRNKKKNNNRKNKSVTTYYKASKLPEDESTASRTPQ